MAGMLLFGNELAIKRACARARVDYIRILGINGDAEWKCDGDEASCGIISVLVE